MSLNPHGASPVGRRYEPVASSKHILVLAHTGRPAAVVASEGLVRALTEAGLGVTMFAAEAAELPSISGLVNVVDSPSAAMSRADLVIVVGGDGTILRAIEMTRGNQAPLLGINLGHVGFLAESEREDIHEVVRRVATSRYTVEERMSLDVVISKDGQELARSFALNEVSVEKLSRLKMLEVATEIDGRPVSSFGCDGIVVATPTGSTAYAFSAGGPVVWPEVEALLVVPLSAHALFARPMVVSPNSLVAVEVLDSSPEGIAVCDGRRTIDLPSGCRIEVTRGAQPVRLARLNLSPFTDRLVAKFRLPVTGWRGPLGTA